MPKLDDIKLQLNKQLLALDRDGNGKVDANDARMVAEEAVASALSFQQKNPVAALVIAFAIGVVCALFGVSLKR